MISLRLKSSFSIALICFVLGCCTAFLMTANCSGTGKQPAITQAKMLQVQADSLQAHYQATITTLESRNKQLTVELQNTKTELNAVKAKTKSKATTIKKMIAPPGYPAKDLLQKASTSSFTVDSSLEKCDSLAQLVMTYIEDTETKDSLYEVHSLQQDNLIASKEEIIALRKTENMNLSILFKQSLWQQQVLEKNNQSLRKRMKRQRAGGRWLALGTAILSGVATHYITNR